MTRQLTKKYLFKSINISGAYKFIKKLRRGASVLFYHGVVDEIINPVVQETHMSFDLFKKQIYYLLNNFEIISLDHLYDCISNGYEISPSQVLITLDDGYKSNFDIVAPFLQSLDIPFAVFISTNHIEHGERFPYYYLQAAIYYTNQKHAAIPSINRSYDLTSVRKRVSAITNLLNIIKTVSQKTVNMIVKDLVKLLSHDRWSELDSIFYSDEPMNWEEVKKLHNSGVTIGSHCHDHSILHPGQDKSEAEFQLETSKQLIEKNLGTCKYFAYPNGRAQDISPHSLKCLEKHRYLLGFTTVRGEIEKNMFNRYVLPRFFPRKDMDSFKFVLHTGFRHTQNYYNWHKNSL